MTVLRSWEMVFSDGGVSMGVVRDGEKGLGIMKMVFFISAVKDGVKGFERLVQRQYAAAVIVEEMAFRH